MPSLPNGARFRPLTTILDWPLTTDHRPLATIAGPTTPSRCSGCYNRLECNGHMGGMNHTVSLTTNAISITGLAKSFGATRALDGLDLCVKVGEVHGFLGPNGAGKTTTIRILLGLMRGDAGKASLLGGDPWRDAVQLHRRLAYVPGDVTLWPDLSGGEVIDLLGRLRGGLDARRRTDLLQLFDLDPTKKCATYSKGNRQKVALVAALASEASQLGCSRADFAPETPLFHDPPRRLLPANTDGCGARSNRELRHRVYAALRIALLCLIVSLFVLQRRAARLAGEDDA